MTPSNETVKVDFNILNSLIPRLWAPTSLSETVLALEAIDGPYKGVVFGFTKFDVLPTQLSDGFYPVRFETKVYQAPENFAKDEAFDNWCGEVFLAWLTYIQQHDMKQIINAIPREGIH